MRIGTFVDGQWVWREEPWSPPDSTQVAAEITAKAAAYVRQGMGKTAATRRAFKEVTGLDLEVKPDRT